MAGVLLIIGGVLVLAGNLREIAPERQARRGRLCADHRTFIAAYTLWDKQAVSRFAIMPMVLDWGANLGRAILLTPLRCTIPDEAVIEWREHKWEAIAVAILIPLSYILVLTAMQFYAGELRRAGA